MKFGLEFDPYGFGFQVKTDRFGYTETISSADTMNAAIVNASLALSQRIVIDLTVLPR